MTSLRRLLVSCLLLALCSAADVAPEEGNKEVQPVAALVLARIGSKGVFRKNLAKIGNETLIARTLKTLNASGVFQTIWVSTDSNDIAEEASLYSSQVHWRHPSTAYDNSSSISAVTEFIHYYPSIKVIALFQCTSPFLTVEDIVNAYTLIQKENTDCVFSITKSFQLRWTKHGNYTMPLNFDVSNRPRRQDWDGEMVENGMFYFVVRKVALRGMFQNHRCRTVEIPESRSIDINTEFDLKMANLLLAQQSQPTS